MDRKPLINARKVSPYYRSNSAYSMLISGNCSLVKSKVISNVIMKKDMPVVVINLDANSSYFSHSIHYDFSIGRNTGYDLFSSMTIREACAFCRDVAHEENYPNDQVVQIIKYLDFIQKLNEYLNLDLRTINDINNHYYSPEVINKAINEMFCLGKINKGDYDRLITRLVRGIKGQLIIDDILSMTNFELNSNGNTDFSIGNLKSGQTAFIDLAPRHNSYTETRARNNVLYSIEGYCAPISVILNVGRSDFSTVEAFVRNMTVKSTCQFITIIDDLFAQISDYDRVRRSFSLNLLGQHTGASCQKMSECFHEIYKTEKHYARAVDRRLMSERFIDVLCNTNHTDTTTLIPVKRSIIEQQDIASLSERAFIMIDNTGSANYFSLHSI